jgi:hypothetical protein
VGSGIVRWLARAVKKDWRNLSLPAPGCILYSTDVLVSQVHKEFFKVEFGAGGGGGGQGRGGLRISTNMTNGRI